MAIIPLTWACLLLLTFGRDETSNQTLTEAVVVATSITGLLAFLIPPALSLGSHLTASGVAAVWAVALVATGALGWRRIVKGTGNARRILRSLVSLPTSHDAGRFERLGEVLWRVLLLGWLGATLATALLYQPTVWDSYAHHLPRIFQFIQNQSVAPFPTYYPTMNSTYPFAAYVLTQVKLLSGGSDALLNLLQWSAYWVTLLVVYSVSRQLGATSTGARFSTLVAMSAPAVALQASSTQYDLVVGMWSLFAAYVVLRLISGVSDSQVWPTALLLGIIVGLGAVTKVTFIICAAPFLLWGLLSVGRRYPPARTASMAIVACAAAALIGLPWFGQNLAGTGDLLGVNVPGNRHIVVRDRSVGAVWMNTVRNLSMEFGTPSAGVNRVLERAAGSIASALGTPIDSPTNKESDVPYALSTSATNRDLAPAPLTVVLIALSAAMLIVAGYRRNRTAWLYSVGGMSGVIAIAALITWQPYIVRTFVAPLLVLTPITGVALEFPSRRGATASRRPASVAVTIVFWGLAALAVAYGAFVVAFNTSSPLVPRPSNPWAEDRPGWWDTPYAERGFVMTSPFLEATRQRLESLPPQDPRTTDRPALVSGDGAETMPVYGLIQVLSRKGYRVCFASDYPPADGRQGDPVWSKDPGIVVSIDDPERRGSARVGPTSVAKLDRFTMLWNVRVPELDRSISVWKNTQLVRPVSPSLREEQQ